MSEPWNLTEAQRRQFREAHAEAKRHLHGEWPSGECGEESGSSHDWQPDPSGYGEGLRCTRCLVTEAELEAREAR